MDDMLLFKHANLASSCHGSDNDSFIRKRRAKLFRHGYIAMVSHKSDADKPAICRQWFMLLSCATST